MENPKGDNRLDLDKLKRVSSSIFGTNNTPLRFFNGGAGENWFWPSCTHSCSEHLLVQGTCVNVHLDCVVC